MASRMRIGRLRENVPAVAGAYSSFHESVLCIATTILDDICPAIMTFVTTTTNKTIWRSFENFI